MPNEILSGMKWHLNQSCHPGLDAWKLTRTWGVIKSGGRGKASFSGLYVLQPLKKKKKNPSKETFHETKTLWTVKIFTGGTSIL